MADDPLKIEIEAAISVLEPQLRGLEDLAKIEAPAEVIALVNAQFVKHQQRYELLLEVLKALDGVATARKNLDDDGYPAIPTVPIDSTVAAEFKEELADIEAAAALFTDSKRASVLKIDLGETGEK